MQIIQEPGDPAHIGLVLSLEEFEIFTAALGIAGYKHLHEAITDKRFEAHGKYDYESMKQLVDRMYKPISSRMEDMGLWM